MDQETSKIINRTVKNFYDRVFEYFNTSRQFYWDGWENLIPYFKTKSVKVLDLGCGNGRFGQWLEKKGKTVDYTGVDRNTGLLKYAKKTIKKGRFYQFDLLNAWPKLDKDYDAAILMAVLHHIPGRDNRLSLLKKVKSYLKKDGVMVFTVWHFNQYKRFNKQVIKWSSIGVNKNKVEANDWLLDWKKGQEAIRYIHLFDNEEIEWLYKNLKMEKLADFVSDGRQGQGNRYVVLKKV